MWSYKVLFDTRHQVLYTIRDVCNENVGDSREEISDEEYQVSTTSKEEALLFLVEKGTLLLST